MAGKLGDGGDRKAQWQRRWQETADADFGWSLDNEVPSQLRTLLDAAERAPGRAIDIGCGAGTSTAFLAERFSFSVGVDIAPGAVKQAKARHGEQGPTFSVADARSLPFAPRAFQLAFDRGCLQNLPRPLWEQYFAQVDHVLDSGGTLVLLVSKATAQFSSIGSVRGLRQRWNWYVRRTRGGAQFLSHDFLRSIKPPSFQIETLEDFPFVRKEGKGRLFTYAVYTKR